MVTGVTKPAWPVGGATGRFVHTSGILEGLILNTSRYFIRSSSEIVLGGKGLRLSSSKPLYLIVKTAYISLE
jgi:hypothetical protein